jgi:hypothetical protein
VGLISAIPIRAVILIDSWPETSPSDASSFTAVVNAESNPDYTRHFDWEPEKPVVFSIGYVSLFPRCFQDAGSKKQNRMIKKRLKEPSPAQPQGKMVKIIAVPHNLSLPPLPSSAG